MGMMTIPLRRIVRRFTAYAETVDRAPLPVLSRADWFIAGAVFIVSLVLLLPLAPDALPGGDAAVYAHQMRQADFGLRTIHLGYYLAGALFDRLTPLPPDYTINAMSVFFAALGLALLTLISRTVFGHRRPGVISCALLLSNYLFLGHAVLGEIYIVQTAFALLAVLLWLRRRSHVAGAALAAAFLVSPTAVLVVPGLAVLRPRLGPLVRLLAWPAAAGLLLLICVRQDYLYGPRGVLVMAADYALPWAAVAAKEWRELFLGLYLALPLAVSGALGAVRARGLPAAFLGSLAATGLAIALFGERTVNIPAQLLSFALFTLFAGSGFVRLYRGEAGQRGEAASVLAVGVVAAGAGAALSWKLSAVFGVVLLFQLIVAHVVRRATSTRLCLVLVPLLLLLVLAGNGTKAGIYLGVVSDQALSFKARVLAARCNAPSRSLAVGGWSRSVLFDHYVCGRPYGGSVIIGEGDDPGEQPQLRRAAGSGTEIWLLEPLPLVETWLGGRGYVIEPAHGFQRAYRPVSRNTSEANQ